MGKRMKKVLASAMSLSMVASMAMSGVGATTSRVDSLLSNMTLRQKITQMMLILESGKLKVKKKLQILLK